MSSKKEIIEYAESLQEELTKIRHQLHENPEIGFELPKTKQFVIDTLGKMGYQPKEVGKCGVVAIAGGKTDGPCVMIRADMDALSMTEETNLPFKSKTDGVMHGCGHDMHTTMLLGAAKILKKFETDIVGTVKLVFQPAEEIFQGSLDMMEAGVLRDPKVDAAIMMHVVAGLPMAAGMFMVPKEGGITMNTCEQYRITVKGKGGHGSMPQNAIDPITAAAQIHLALMEINSRELGQDEYGVFTTCSFQAGNTSNVIPDSAVMRGTIRTADLDRAVNQKIKTRIKEIAQGISKAMRCEADVEFSDFCPCMKIDRAVTRKALASLQDMFGTNVVSMETKPGGGSEDFSFISHEVPATSVFITAGNSNEGYTYGQHNPKVVFDENCLSKGSAAYAYMAMQFTPSTDSI